METAVLLDPLTVKDSSGNTINPSTEESVALLRRILKVLESNAVTDIRQRQRITIDAIGTVATTGLPAAEVTTTLPVSGTVTVGAVTAGATMGTSVANASQGPSAAAPLLTTSATIYQPVWEGPVDQRWRIIDASRTAFAVGVRQNLVWS